LKRFSSIKTYVPYLLSTSACANAAVTKNVSKIFIFLETFKILVRLSKLIIFDDYSSIDLTRLKTLFDLCKLYTKFLIRLILRSNWLLRKQTLGFFIFLIFFLKYETYFVPFFQELAGEFDWSYVNHSYQSDVTQIFVHLVCFVYFDFFQVTDGIL
jgi:hypothetical protein